MRFEPSGMTNDPDILAAKSIVDDIFRWMGKKFLSTDQQEEIGILSAEVRARLAASYNALDAKPADTPVAVEAAPPGQTALQQLGRRSGVRKVRRPHGANRELLHRRGLRD
jgi:ribonucleoside-diphosphate reductase alpha chain